MSFSYFFHKKRTAIPKMHLLELLFFYSKNRRVIFLNLNHKRYFIQKNKNIRYKK